MISDTREFQAGCEGLPGLSRDDDEPVGAGGGGGGGTFDPNGWAVDIVMAVY